MNLTLTPNLMGTSALTAAGATPKVASLKPVLGEVQSGDRVTLSSGNGRQTKLDPIEAALANYAAAKEKTYYDEPKDVQSQAKYYGELKLEGTAAENFKALSKLVQQTHANNLPYEPSSYLYPWVDLRPNLQLESIYSSTNIDAVASIKEDFAKAEYWNTVSQMAMTATVAPTVAAAQIALTSNSYLNCEHVVCQSWFDHAQPMRGDLHHLFSCDPNCNSFRGNRPLAAIPSLEAELTGCGTLSAGAKSFEPVQGKGAAARATFYFLVRYPKKIDEYQVEDLETLMRWNKEDPPGLYEKHRNQAIEELQGNRNPFVDHPEWADKIDFSLGVRKRRRKKSDQTPVAACPIPVSKPVIAVDAQGRVLAQP